jgi:hypothetical protein
MRLLGDSAKLLIHFIFFSSHNNPGQSVRKHFKGVVFNPKYSMDNIYVHHKFHMAEETTYNYPPKIHNTTMSTREG